MVAGNAGRTRLCQPPDGLELGDGKSYPDVHSLLILSDLFGVSLDELIKGDVEMMKSTIQNEDAGRLRKLRWLGIAEMFGMMFGATLLVEYGGEIGTILGCLLAGILSVCIFMTFRGMEQIKQENDIETYREVLAFQRGETLDDIEKERKKRKSQRTENDQAALMDSVCAMCRERMPQWDEYSLCYENLKNIRCNMQEVGVTRQTIGMIEAGNYNLMPNLRIAICDALGNTLNGLT